LISHEILENRDSERSILILVNISCPLNKSYKAVKLFMNRNKFNKKYRVIKLNIKLKSF